MLGSSRWLWGRFCADEKLETVLRCHIMAFEAAGGAPEEILCDRMKTAVQSEAADGTITYNRSLLPLLSHYGAAPRACRPYRAKTKNVNASDRVGPMLSPPHLGELIRESMDDVGWNVTETAARLGCERGTLSRLLNGKAGVSANMALALEDIGWGTAEHWMRMQASYELAQARRGRIAAEWRVRALHA